MIGADAFSAMARSAEDAAKTMDTAYLDTNHEPLLHAYGQLTELLGTALASEFSTEEQPATPADTAAAVSVEALCGHLQQLADCLKTFEAERAEEILNDLAQKSCSGQDLSGLLSDIRSDVDDFEMDAALQKVHRLIGQLQAQLEEKEVQVDVRTDEQTDEQMDEQMEAGGWTAGADAGGRES